MVDDPSQLSNLNDRHEDSAEDPLPNIDEDDPDRVDISTRRELLKAGHVPEGTRVVGRDEKIKDIAAEPRPIVQNDPPNNVMTYGKTGTGESLAVRHVTERVRRAAEPNGVSVGTAYVGCAQHDTQTRTARTATRELDKTEKINFDAPRAGIGSGEYYDCLQETLNLTYDVVVVILDEVDRLNDDDILMQFLRARESGKTDCHLGVTAVSNKIEYRDQLNERVKSSLREEEFVSQSYDANQPRGITKYHRDAFHDDVLSDDVIPPIAALATQEHGDVRKVIEILRHTGEPAERENADQVVAEHVRDVQEWAGADRFEELFRRSMTQIKFTPCSPTLLTEESSNEDEFSISRTYKRYQNTAEAVDAKVLSEHRAYELLKEQMFLGVVELTQTGGGRGEGSYFERRLVQDTGIVLKSVLRDSRLEDLV